MTQLEKGEKVYVRGFCHPLTMVNPNVVTFGEHNQTQGSISIARDNDGIHQLIYEWGADFETFFDNDQHNIDELTTLIVSVLGDALNTIGADYGDDMDYYFDWYAGAVETLNESKKEHKL